jgi:hypothetical protein
MKGLNFKQLLVVLFFFVVIGLFPTPITTTISSRNTYVTLVVDQTQGSLKNLESNLAISTSLDPKIVHPSDLLDKDGDKIADSLTAILKDQTQNLSVSIKDNAIREDGKKVAVTLCVDKKPNDVMIAKLRLYGAEIVSIYDKLSYSISAIIPIKRVKTIAADPEITFIEKEAYSYTHLDTSTVNLGVRRSDYVWDAVPAIKGNSNYAIAILDTGVDSSHSDMTNFLYFRDFSDEGYLSGSTGVDYGHHGTHCASIAAGTGAADINPQTVNQTISSQFSDNVAQYYTTHWFEVKDNPINPNTIVRLNWDTSGSNIGAYFGIKNSTGIWITSFGPYSTSPLSHTLGNIETGWYQVVVAPYGTESTSDTFNKDYTISFEHEYDYALSSEPANTPVFAGVAPQSKIVCLKVLNDTGSGTGTWFKNALDWIVDNGKNPAYNITTISMSLGFDGIYADIDTKINNLVDEGFICVASAGNDGTNSGNNAINSPGSAQKCITVGAVNDAFEITYYSSNGNTTLNKPDVVAPGGTLALSESGSLHNLILAADSNYGEDDNSMSDAQLAIDAIIQIEGNWTWSQANVLRVKQLICMGTWEVNAGETLDWDEDAVPQNPPLNRIGSDVVEGYGMVRADALIQAITHPTTDSFTDIDYNLDNRSGSSAKESKVFLFSFAAETGRSYEFSLNVPTTGDFDLLIYDDEYDSSTGRPIISISSINNGLGVDESLVFTPIEDGTYYWSIRVTEGYGTCQASLTIGNAGPDSPVNPSPSDGATGVSLSPTLSISVSDPDGDPMDVSFYNASDDSLIGTDIGVLDNDFASITWSELAEGITYSWYTVVDDGSASTTSIHQAGTPHPLIKLLSMETPLTTI